MRRNGQAGLMASTACPTCGRPFVTAARKYATEAERRAGIAAAHETTRRRRFDADVLEILPRLGATFKRRDVSRACVSAGRHWSQGEGVLLRLVRYGAIRRLPTVEERGRLLPYEWERTPAPAGAASDQPSS
jgi:hypothetical protein